MRRKELVLSLAFLGVFSFQVLWHWFLSGSLQVARSLSETYLHHGRRWDAEGWLDLVLPAVLLGLTTGWVGSQWSVAKLACFILVAGAGIAGLMPVYLLFVDRSAVWFWNGTVSDFGLQFVKACALTGFLACLGYAAANGRRNERKARGE